MTTRLDALKTRMAVTPAGCASPMTREQQERLVAVVEAEIVTTQKLADALDQSFEVIVDPALAYWLSSDNAGEERDDAR